MAGVAVTMALQGVHIEPISFQMRGGKQQRGSHSQSLYNQNFMSLLRKYESAGKITIREELPGWVDYEAGRDLAGLVIWDKVAQDV